MSEDPLVGKKFSSNKDTFKERETGGALFYQNVFEINVQVSLHVNQTSDFNGSNRVFSVLNGDTNPTAGLPHGFKTNHQTCSM